MSVVSIIRDPKLEYPDADHHFSPSESYPECPFGPISPKPNPAYAAVRRVLQQAGLDREHFDTSAWNPLGGFISRGSRVFVLCNFVYHRRANESPRDFLGKCTHGSVLRAILDYVLIAAGPQGRILFGNAPLQSCKWEQVLHDTGANKVLEFYAGHQVGNVAAADNRLFVAERDALGRVSGVQRHETLGAVSVDLGAHSLLQEIAGCNGSKFRVSDYDPQRTVLHHQHGQHVYLVHPLVLEADVVLNLPKLKTHEKVGVTCGLKGMVGAIAHKDCLAHHRFGGTQEGGDEYPDGSRLRHALSRFHDSVNRHDPLQTSDNLLRVVDQAARRLIRMAGGIQFGSWYGNDTAWRMALDITRVLIYGCADGSMSSSRQRQHLLLVDGVVGGEGAGPLAPAAKPTGAVLFSDDIALGDWACAYLMGFDPRKVALIREAFCARRYAVSAAIPERASIVLNGEVLPLEDPSWASPHSYRPPRGWIGHIELERARDDQTLATATARS